MVYRMGMTILKRRPCITGRAAVAEDGLFASPVITFRDFSSLSNFFLLLLRSRGALERVRATPGAPSAAAASMDGPDGRAADFPGGGKGLRLVPRAASYQVT